MSDEETPKPEPIGEPPPEKVKVEYNPAMVEQVRKIASLGAIDREIADILGIDVQVFWRWKTKYPELEAALAVGKEGPDARVKRSLYQKAVGYNYPAVKVFQTKEGKALIVPYTEHVPPDTVACIFWTKNRLPDEFRDVKGIEHSGAVRQEHKIEELSDEAIRQQLRRIDNALAEEGNAGTSAAAAAGKKGPAAVH